MARRRRAVGQVQEQPPGIEAKVNEAQAHSRGWRVPKWAYGAAALAVAAYLGVRLATAAPESKTQPQVNPPAITTPVGQPTPVVTSVMPGLENILTEQQIVQYATQLQPVQTITPEVLSKVEALNKTLYFQFTGNTFENAKFTIRFLTSEDYDKLIASKEVVPSDGSISFGPNGVTYINVRSDTGKTATWSVFKTLAHEIGNAEAHRRSLTPEEHFRIIPHYTNFLKEVEQKNSLGKISDTVKTEYLQWIERELADALRSCRVSQIRRVRNKYG